MCAAMVGGLSGCLRHPPKLMLLTVWRAPVEMEVPAGPPPLVPTPEVDLPDVPLAEAGGRLPVARRRARPTAGASTIGAAPQGVVDAPEPETVDIGNLTAGGDATPQSRQEAADLIESTYQRLKALSSGTMSAHRSQVTRVKNFQQQAQRALASGDADGAKNLATKGKLLLDDMLK
jgi:hypothetical protein